jgi:hypothetical protein
MVVWESTTCGSQRDIALNIQVKQFVCYFKGGGGEKLAHLNLERIISLLININFIFCRTNGMRGLMIYVVNHGHARKYTYESQRDT